MNISIPIVTSTRFYGKKIVYCSKSLQHAITLQKTYQFNIIALPPNVCPIQYHSYKQDLNLTKLATTFNIWTPIQSYKNIHILGIPYILYNNILFNIDHKTYEFIIRK